jgi:hypothetical protein
MPHRFHPSASGAPPSIVFTVLAVRTFPFAGPPAGDD